MQVFKCKMCGGDLNVEEGMTITTCGYCGSTMTLPRLDDDKISNLFDRGNHYRRNNDFDKAMAVYEAILNEDNANAEAHWSVVLCRYGIEYVEDPESHKRVPTCNRTQLTSILVDPDYQEALKYTDVQSRRIYEDEAKVIDKVQREILSVSSKEEPYDIFISYKDTDQNGRRTKDSVLAQEIYFSLIREGYKVFFSRITLENVLGSAYEPHIFAALHSSRVMIVVGTQANYLNSPWVKNEWGRYLDLIKTGAKKTLIPAYRDMDPYDLPDEFSHLQALDMNKLGFIQDLLHGVNKILTSKENNKASDISNARTEPTFSNTSALTERAFICIEDSDFEKADDLLEQALNFDPRNARAYLGKFLVQNSLNHEDMINQLMIDVSGDKNISKAIRFGDSDLIKSLTQHIEIVNENIRRHNESVREENERKLAAKEELYQKAKIIYESGNIGDAKEIFKKLGQYKDSARIVKQSTPGERFTFGLYKTSSDTQPKALTWTVIDIDREYILLLCDEPVVYKRFDNFYYMWKESGIRQWLNETFIYEAFPVNIRSKMVIVDNITRVSYKNRNVENTTEDAIFLLDKEQIMKYIKFINPEINSLEFSEDTPPAVTSWFLRSSSESETVDCIINNRYLGKSLVSKQLGIRPALWIKSEFLLKDSEGDHE